MGCGASTDGKDKPPAAAANTEEPAAAAPAAAAAAPASSAYPARPADSSSQAASSGKADEGGKSGGGMGDMAVAGLGAGLNFGLDIFNKAKDLAKPLAASVVQRLQDEGLSDTCIAFFEHIQDRFSRGIASAIGIGIKEPQGDPKELFDAEVSDDDEVMGEDMQAPASEVMFDNSEDEEEDPDEPENEKKGLKASMGRKYAWLMGNDAPPRQKRGKACNSGVVMDGPPDASSAPPGEDGAPPPPRSLALNSGAGQELGDGGGHSKGNCYVCGHACLDTERVGTMRRTGAHGHVSCVLFRRGKIRHDDQVHCYFRHPKYGWGGLRQGRRAVGTLQRVQGHNCIIEFPGDFYDPDSPIRWKGYFPEVEICPGGKLPKRNERELSDEAKAETAARKAAEEADREARHEREAAAAAARRAQEEEKAATRMQEEEEAARLRQIEDEETRAEMAELERIARESAEEEQRLQAEEDERQRAAAAELAATDEADRAAKGEEENAMAAQKAAELAQQKAEREAMKAEMAAAKAETKRQRDEQAAARKAAEEAAKLKAQEEAAKMRKEQPEEKTKPTGTAFTDAHFDSADNMGDDGTYQRPGRGEGLLDKGFKVFGRFDPMDINQGGCGDCWLLAAVATLADFEGVLEELFITSSVADDSKYKVKLYNATDGKPVIYEIDDRIKMYSWSNANQGNGRGVAKYTQPTADNEFWPCLLEKAVAIHCGGYNNIQGGLSHAGFTMLTGCMDCKCYLRADDGTGTWQCWSPAPYTENCQPNGSMTSAGAVWPSGEKGWTNKPVDFMFDLLKEFAEKNYPICVGSISGSDKHNTNGIVLGHAFSILQVVERKGFKLIQIRNPHGKTEWEGAWADGSKEWDENPDIKAELKPEIGNDGLFWITMPDFNIYYEAISVAFKSFKRRA